MGGQTVIIEKHDKISFSKFYNGAWLIQTSQSEKSCVHTPPNEQAHTTNRQAAHAETGGKSGYSRSSNFYSPVTMVVVAVASLLGCHGHFYRGNISSYTPPPPAHLSVSLYVTYPGGCKSYRFVTEHLTVPL